MRGVPYLTELREFLLQQAPDAARARWEKLI
jgi:hypothetical protein